MSIGRNMSFWTWKDGASRLSQGCLQWCRWRRRLLHQAPKVYVWLNKSVEEEGPRIKYRDLKLITGGPSSTAMEESMGGQGVEYGRGEGVHPWGRELICLRPWGDGLHLPPPMGQKLSARRCVNFEVACPDFASRVQPHRHSTQACNAKCFFLSQKRPSTEHGTMRAAVNIIHGWQHPSSSRLLGKLSAILWQSWKRRSRSSSCGRCCGRALVMPSSQEVVFQR